MEFKGHVRRVGHPPHALAGSNAYGFAALVAVVERKGILTQREILEEIQRQRKKKAQ